MGKSAPLTLAFVGLGDIADAMIWPVRLNRRIRVTACMDIVPERAEGFAGKNGIKMWYTDYKTMLSAGGFSAVYLAVPHFLHADMILQALEAGYHVFVEKPVTLTVEEAQRVEAEAGRTGLKVAVNYQYRYNAGAARMMQKIHGGSIGKPLSAVVQVPWSRDESYFSKAPWHGRKAQAGGGTLLTQGSHVLDIALDVLGAGAVSGHSVLSSYRHTAVEVEDHCAGVLKLENGCTVTLLCTMAGSPEMPVTLTVRGTGGTLVFTGPANPTLTLWTQKGKRTVRRRVFTSRLGVLNELAAVYRSLESFREWINGGPEHRVSVGNAIPVLEACMLLYENAES